MTIAVVQNENTVEKTETPEAIAAAFAACGIRAVTYRHRPVFTVDEGRDLKVQMPGGHTKNLFLRDKAENMWLVTAAWDTAIDLKKLQARLRTRTGVHAGRLSFGSPDRLLRVLGVTPGSVTPLALMHDRDRCRNGGTGAVGAIPVNFAIDSRLMAEEILNCHPLRNDMTTALIPQDLLKLLESWGYMTDVIDFSCL